MRLLELALDLILVPKTLYRIVRHPVQFASWVETARTENPPHASWATPVTFWVLPIAIFLAYSNEALSVPNVLELFGSVAGTTQFLSLALQPLVLTVLTVVLRKPSSKPNMAPALDAYCYLIGAIVFVVLLGIAAGHLSIAVQGRGMASAYRAWLDPPAETSFSFFDTIVMFFFYAFYVGVGLYTIIGLGMINFFLYWSRLELSSPRTTIL
jgi:hypothetical protein